MLGAWSWSLHLLEVALGAGLRPSLALRNCQITAQGRRGWEPAVLMLQLARLQPDQAVLCVFFFGGGEGLGCRRAIPTKISGVRASTHMKATHGRPGYRMSRFDLGMPLAQITCPKLPLHTCVPAYPFTCPVRFPSPAPAVPASTPCRLQRMRRGGCCGSSRGSGSARTHGSVARWQGRVKKGNVDPANEFQGVGAPTKVV